MVSATKDPVKVRAGSIGAHARWGDTPRVVRLDDLSSPQRRLVLALVDAARAEQQKAAAEGQSPAAARENRRGDVDSPA